MKHLGIHVLLELADRLPGGSAKSPHDAQAIEIAGELVGDRGSASDADRNACADYVESELCELLRRGLVERGARRGAFTLTHGARHALTLLGLEIEKSCLVCGCTDSRSCPNGCHWPPTERLSVCSNCVSRIER